jgi:hypothetical protein
VLQDTESFLLWKYWTTWLSCLRYFTASLIRRDCYKYIFSILRKEASLCLIHALDLYSEVSLPYCSTQANRTPTLRSLCPLVAERRTDFTVLKRTCCPTNPEFPYLCVHIVPEIVKRISIKFSIGRISIGFYQSSTVKVYNRLAVDGSCGWLVSTEAPYSAINQILTTAPRLRALFQILSAYKKLRLSF